MITCEHCAAQIEDNCKTCPYCLSTIVKTKDEEKSDKDDIAFEFFSKENTCENEIRYAMPDTEFNSSTPKSRIVAGLLGIFLGGLGVHNFYLGNNKKAVIQLVLCLLGCCSGVSAAISCIWGFIEGILILAGNINIDGDGNALGK